MADLKQWLTHATHSESDPSDTGTTALLAVGGDRVRLSDVAATVSDLAAGDDGDVGVLDRDLKLGGLWTLSSCLSSASPPENPFVTAANLASPSSGDALMTGMATAAGVAFWAVLGQRTKSSGFDSLTFHQRQFAEQRTKRNETERKSRTALTLSNPAARC